MDVRSENPAPRDEPASPDLAPRPERQRMDVRSENPAPRDEPASPDLAPRPERQRMDVRSENPAPRDEPASPDLPPRPDPRDEERQRREEEKQRREEQRQLSYVERYAMDGTERAGAQLTKHRPAPTPALWDAVRTRLDDEQHAATTPVHKLQREIELEIVAVAEHGSKRSRSRRIPPPQPEAVAEMVQAVKDRADQLMRPLDDDRQLAAGHGLQSLPIMVIIGNDWRSRF